MALAKLSSALLIGRVIPQTRKAKTMLFGMIATFAIFSPFATSFRCGIPEWTMHSLRCRNGGLAIAVVVSNIVTDLLLAFWMVPALWEMSLNKEKSVAAAMLFGVRAMYVRYSRQQHIEVLTLQCSIRRRRSDMGHVEVGF
jgi:hypothetical protein